MTINKTTNGDVTILALAGRLDTTTAPELQQVLIPAFDTANSIELDFSELAYVSSAGLRVLLMGEKTAKLKNSKMSVSHVSTDIMEVFEMTGFDSVLNIM